MSSTSVIVDDFAYMYISNLCYSFISFLPRDVVLARYAVVLCPSVRRLQAGIACKPPDESSWFWHGGFLPPIPHGVVGKFGYL